MKFTLFAFFSAVVSAVTFETTDCGGPAAMGSAGHVSSLESAGYEFVVSTLVVNPNLTSIALKTEDNYKFSVRPPNNTQFTDFFIRAELKGSYILEPTGPGIKFAPGCEGNVTGLTSTDLAPKSLIQGKFSLRDIGDYTIDVTVVQESDTVLYTRYKFLVDEELPDFPTVTPKRVTPVPTTSPTKKAPSLAPVAGIPTVVLNSMEDPVSSTPPAASPVASTKVPVASTAAVPVASTTGVPVPVAPPMSAPVTVPVAPAAPVTVPVAVPVTPAPVPEVVNQQPATSSGRYTCLVSLFGFGVVASIMV